MSAAETEYTLRRQTEAAKSLLSGLRADGEDDAELVADAIEGETDLLEAISEALAANDDDEALVIGLKAKEGQFEARRNAIQKRIERRTALIEQAMVATEQTTFRLPTATLTLAKRAPGVVIANEADIPARFWIAQERPAPKLDKAALKEALKAKEAVPGASLDNGSVSLTVRRK
ncbi:siphovirus Gp157 family protein [Devosia epidermidihirudinis]|uniref:Siphovirus Gp157 family protein n=1 Tax=Devosia epidermidihirudinis TaxID=1293439 RepID=A0A0F5QHS3_9HYPH|nr:siphovirus Gp157 family protein [Devosia epidermidihirudinis]KKC39549.1 siphovirus Gp157 family protein [Devosia epidermidihirudinis]